MIPDIHAIENRAEKSLQNLLVFRLGNQAFALSIEVVVQIIPMLKLTPLPQTDSVIEGVVNIRGTITPVMNVRRRLNMDTIPAKLHTPIILIRLGSHLIGLIVDEVIDILSLPAGQIATPDQILPQGLEVSKVLEGVIFLDSHNILLLNPYMLVSPASTLSRIKNVQAPAQDYLVSQAVEFQAPAIPEKITIIDQPARSVVSAPVPEKSVALPSKPEDCDNPQDIPLKTEAVAPVAPIQPQREHKKPKKRKSSTPSKAEKVLAEQVANLAVDLPPVEGSDEPTDVSQTDSK